jgi:hypothetical protein
MAIGKRTDYPGEKSGTQRPVLRSIEDQKTHFVTPAPTAQSGLASRPGYRGLSETTLPLGTPDNDIPSMGLLRSDGNTGAQFWPFRHIFRGLVYWTMPLHGLSVL